MQAKRVSCVAEALWQIAKGAHHRLNLQHLDPNRSLNNWWAKWPSPQLQYLVKTKSKKPSCQINDRRKHLVDYLLKSASQMSVLESCSEGFVKS